MFVYVHVCYLSFSNEISNNGGVAKLSCKVDTGAALAVNQRWIRAQFHQLNHHREMPLPKNRDNRPNHVIVGKMTSRKKTLT